MASDIGSGAVPAVARRSIRRTTRVRSVLLLLALAVLGAAIVAHVAANRLLFAREPRLPAAGSRHGASVASAAEGLAYSGAGPHLPAWRRVSVEPQLGRGFTALVFYPGTRSEEGADIDAHGGPYPGIAFGHGYFQAPARYTGTLAHLASWGFIVIAPESQAGPLPDHRRFASDLVESLTYLVRSSAESGSWLAGSVDEDHLGASGHSMGGGVSLLAAAADERIRAVSALAAADARPSAAAAMPKIGVPVQLIVGTEDAIVRPSSSWRLYDAARPPKLFLRIVGGSHCGFQSDPFPLVCDDGSLASEEQLDLTAHAVTAFFRLYLADDPDASAYVWGLDTLDRIIRGVRDPGTSG